MEPLTAAEAEEFGVDPDRTWLRVQCPNGHESVVQDHEGGSYADCTSCGERFAYNVPVEKQVDDIVTGSDRP